MGNASKLPKNVQEVGVGCQKCNFNGPNAHLDPKGAEQKVSRRKNSTHDFARVT